MQPSLSLSQHKQGNIWQMSGKLQSKRGSETTVYRSPPKKVVFFCKCTYATNGDSFTTQFLFCAKFFLNSIACYTLHKTKGHAKKISQYIMAEWLWTTCSS